MLALAAQVTHLNNPFTFDFALKVQVPLLDNWVAIVNEEGVANATTNIGSGTADRTFLRALRFHNPVRKRVAEAGHKSLAVVERGVQRRATREAGSTGASGGAGCLQHGRRVEDTVSAANNRPGQAVPRKADAGCPVVEVGRRLAASIRGIRGANKAHRTLQVPAIRAGRARSQLTLERGIGVDVPVRQAIVAFRAGCIHVIPEPQIHRQFRGDLPVILKIATHIRTRCRRCKGELDIAAVIVRQAQQERRHTQALRGRVAGVGDLLREALAESELAGRAAQLREIHK